MFSIQRCLSCLRLRNVTSSITITNRYFRLSSRLLSDCSDIVDKNATYYEVLGVPKNATAANIKDAYFIKTKELHPDKNPDAPCTHEKFVQLTQAYEVLGKAGARRYYDEQLNSGHGGIYVAPHIREKYKGMTMEEIIHAMRMEAFTEDDKASDRNDRQIFKLIKSMAITCVIFFFISSIIIFKDTQSQWGPLEPVARMDEFKALWDAREKARASGDEAEYKKLDMEVTIMQIRLGIVEIDASAKKE